MKTTHSQTPSAPAIAQCAAAPLRRSAIGASVSATQMPRSQSSRCSGSGARRIGCGTLDQEYDAIAAAATAMSSTLHRYTGFCSSGRHRPAMRSPSRAAAQVTGTMPAASTANQFGVGFSARKIELAHAMMARPANAAMRGDSPFSQPVQPVAAGCGSTSPGKSVLESTRIEYQIDTAHAASTPTNSHSCSRLARISRVCLTKTMNATPTTRASSG